MNRRAENREESALSIEVASVAAQQQYLRGKGPKKRFYEYPGDWSRVTGTMVNLHDGVDADMIYNEP